MGFYELSFAQYDWLNSASKDDFRRFVVQGPVQTTPQIVEGETRYTGRLRGIKVTQPVSSMALALKEAEAIRREYIQDVGMIPLDEDILGIADTPEQRAAA